jgi:RhtB (resistance to homoserine/threonine) family protein
LDAHCRLAVNFFNREFEEEIELYIEVMLIALLAGMSPGPDFFLVMQNSLGYGRKIGIASAVGIAAALAIHATYTILGLAIIIRNFHYVFVVIQLAGAGYLAYLGISTLGSTFPGKKVELGELQETACRKSCLQAFMNGFLCNILNPKAFVFFLSVFSQFMAPGTSRWVEWIYGFEVVIVIGVWFVAVSSLVASDAFRSVYQKSRMWLERCFGVLLIYFAFRVCKSAFGRD